MRIIIYGTGAIGGTVGVALAHAGLDVVGIARGERLRAIRENGLTLRTPDGEKHAHLTMVEDPAELNFRPGDALMLAMKTQHTAAALERLRAAGWSDGPIFCAQNGVHNEDLALRVFPNVHGVVVMMPASFARMDEALAFSTPRHGVFDIGRFPNGSDEDDRRFAEAMEAANIGAFVDDNVMAGKYGKLLLNLNNILQAALGVGVDAPKIKRAIRAEAEAALKTANIEWRDVGAADPRRDNLMRQEAIEGAPKMGGSTAQSLARGAGSVETDYLNGEIAWIARRVGGDAPVNAALATIGARLALAGASSGTMSVDELTDAIRATGASI